MTYRHAPITEALIDIQVDGVACSLAELKALGGEDFPEIRDISHEQFEFRPGDPSPVSPKTEASGFQFWSKNRQKVWQARTNGFTMSHLAPYDTWEALRDDAKPLWDKYRSLSGGKPKRVAVRYINRFDLPPNGDFEEYFLTIPKIPKPLDTGLSAFLMQLVFPQKDLGATAVITQTPVKGVVEGKVSVVVDIDLFRAAGVPDDEESLWALLEEFRARKNFLFEHSITDKAREVIR